MFSDAIMLIMCFVFNILVCKVLSSSSSQINVVKSALFVLIYLSTDISVSAKMHLLTSTIGVL